MTADPKASIFRVRELEVRYKPHRLRSPFEGRLDKADDVVKLADEMLYDVITDAVLVLHMTKHLRLLGTHRLPTLPNLETTVAEVFRAVLLTNAKVLIYVIRRGSDDSDPRPEDGILVQHMRQVARMFGVELRDAIIISDMPHEVTIYSFRDNGLL